MEEGQNRQGNSESKTPRMAGRLPVNVARVEPSDSSPGDGSPTIRLRIHSTTGNPITRAHVFTLAQDRFELAGTSDSNGVTVVRADTHPYRVVAEGYASKDFTLPVPLPADRVIQLETEYAIEGRVLLPDSSPAGKGLLVMAWKQANPFNTIPYGRLAFERSPALQWAETDEGGNFRISGVDAGPYAVASGGEGYLSQLPVADLEAPYPWVEARVYPVFGAVLSIQDEDGIRPGVRGELTGLRVVKVSPDPTIVPADWDFLALSGSDYHGLGGESYSMPYFATADHDSDLIGPFRLTADFLGYKPLEEEFFLPRARPVPDLLEFVLQRKSVGEGSIEISFLGTERLPVGAFPPPGTTLVLQSQEGAPGRIRVDSVSNGASRLDRIPAGVYGAQLQFDYSVSRFVALEGSQVQVPSCGESSLTFDLSGTQSIGFTVVRADGEPYHGPLTMTTVAGFGHQGGRSHTMHFERSPYVLAGLRETTIRLFHVRPNPHSRVLVFELDSGGDSRGRIVLAD